MSDLGEAVRCDNIALIRGRRPTLSAVWPLVRAEGYVRCDQCPCCELGQPSYDPAYGHKTYYSSVCPSKSN